jgi:hypothetical protein
MYKGEVITMVLSDVAFDFGRWLLNEMDDHNISIAGKDKFSRWENGKWPTYTMAQLFEIFANEAEQ